MTGPRVALVSGFWGQNVGNAFFNLGGRRLLEEAGCAVSFVQDMPAYATFRNERRGNYPNAFPLLDHLDVDVVVLQGPLFTVNFANIWRAQLERLAERGVGWAVLGGAFRKYVAEEKQVAREVVADVPPRFLSTRDRPSAEMLAGLATPCRSGLDSAFFLPEAFEPPSMRTDFVTFTFDHYPEPRLTPDPAGAIAIGDALLSPRHRALGEWAARRSKAHAMASRIGGRPNRLPAEIAGIPIVRPDHRTNPHLPFKIYKDANSIASDDPWTYLTLYANTSLTYSDRVHACVATIAYGRPAMFRNPGTRRSVLFEAAGCRSIATEPSTMSEELRCDEFGVTADFVRRVLE